MIAKIKSNPAYANNSQAKIEAEALITAIGDKGEGLFNNAPNTLAKFKTWLNDFFKRLGAKLGIAKLSPDYKFDKFVRDAVGDLLGGKEIVQEKANNTNENNPIQFQIIGESGAANLSNAIQVLGDLERAKIMQKENKDPKTIWRATGWEFNIGDGKWRNEIADIENKNVDILYDAMTNKNESIFNFNELFINKDLSDAYPELKKLKVKIVNNEEAKNEQGVYDSNKNQIIINNFKFIEFAEKTDKQSILRDTNDLRGLRRVVAHELAHFVQNQEGFELGGNLQSRDYAVEKLTKNAIANSNMDISYFDNLSKWLALSPML